MVCLEAHPCSALDPGGNVPALPLILAVTTQSLINWMDQINIRTTFLPLSFTKVKYIDGRRI